MMIDLKLYQHNALEYAQSRTHQTETIYRAHVVVERKTKGNHRKSNNFLSL